MPTTELHPESYHFLKDYIYRESGIVLDGDKQYLMEARLMPIVHQNRMGTLEELCNCLRTAEGGARVKQSVVEAMTTNETFFFREIAQYQALQTVIIPELIRLRQHGRRMRFWSAASSSGQEAYSLAMTLMEMGLQDWDIKIKGTDLSSRMVERARAGKYLQIEMNRGLPARYLVKYFTRSGLDWQLKDEVKRMVEFSCLDLREQLRTVGPFDVVFCRNVLIYFDIATRKRILEEISGTLFRGGYLLLGASETTLNITDCFERRLCGQAVLYQVP